METLLFPHKHTIQNSQHSSDNINLYCNRHHHFLRPDNHPFQDESIPSTGNLQNEQLQLNADQSVSKEKDIQINVQAGKDLIRKSKIFLDQQWKQQQEETNRTALEKEAAQRKEEKEKPKSETPKLITPVSENRRSNSISIQPSKSAENPKKTSFSLKALAPDFMKANHKRSASEAPKLVDDSVINSKSSNPKSINLRASLSTSDLKEIENKPVTPPATPIANNSPKLLDRKSKGMSTPNLSIDKIMAENDALQKEREQKRNQEVKKATNQIVERGHTIANQTNDLIKDVKTSESGQQLLDESKKLLQNVKEQETTKTIMKEGMQVVDELKKSEKGQELLTEGKQILQSVSSNENFKQLKEHGSNLLQSVKSDQKINEQDLIEIVRKGRELLKEETAEYSKEEISRYLELAQGLLTDVASDKKTDGIALLDNIKTSEKGSNVSSLIKDLKENKDVENLINESKAAVLDLMKKDDGSDSGGSLRDSGSSNGEAKRDPKELIQKGKQIFQNVTTNEHGQAIIKQSREMFEKTINKREVKNLILTSEKFMEDMKGNQKLHELLRSNMRFISELKNIVIPFVVDQLLVYKIPPITGTKSTKIGNVDYTLWDVVFSGLNVPTKGVNIDFKDELIIEITEISADINNMKWKFRQQSFPHIKDDGVADAKVAQAKGSFIFKLVFEDHKPKIVISKLSFELAQLDLKVHNTTVSRLYNWALTLFSESVRSSVQVNLTEFMNKHIGNLTEKLNGLVISFWPKATPPSSQPNSSTNSAEDGTVFPTITNSSSVVENNAIEITTTPLTNSVQSGDSAESSTTNGEDNKQQQQESVQPL